jgi:hypothetical protein
MRMGEVEVQGIAGAHVRRRSGEPVVVNNHKHSATDAQMGIAWWNAMSRQARLAAPKAVEPKGRASPAEAWASWKETSGGFKCEELAHG